MIRVHVGVDHVGNPHVFGRGEGVRRVDVFFADVDSRAFAERSTPARVGCAACFDVLDGPDNHRASSA